MASMNSLRRGLILQTPGTPPRSSGKARQEGEVEGGDPHRRCRHLVDEGISAQPRPPAGARGEAFALRRDLVEIFDDDGGSITTSPSWTKVGTTPLGLSARYSGELIAGEEIELLLLG
jgi:hypothetical protein